MTRLDADPRRTRPHVFFPEDSFFWPCSSCSNL